MLRKPSVYVYYLFKTMEKNRDRISLLISFAVHIAVILAVSPFIVKYYSESNDSLSAEIIKVEPRRQVKRRVLNRHLLRILPAKPAAESAPSLASPTYAPEVKAPKAPVHADLVPTVVTHVSIPESAAPSLPNASFGEEMSGGGPVVIPGLQGRGRGHTPGTGLRGDGKGEGGGIGKGFASLVKVADLGAISDLGNSPGLGIFNTEVVPGHGLIGQVYVPGMPITKLPVFERLTPVYTFLAANLDVPTRNYNSGFPTPEKQTVVENFAIRFRGKLAVGSSGTYTFELYSDDGAKLYINKKLVINNDGVHPARSRRGKLKLEAGMHPVEIHYFQGPRFQIALRWFYKPPNGAMQIVPPRVIFYPGSAN